MKRHLWLLAVVVTSTALGQQPPERAREVDVTKRRVVERPIETVVADLSPQGELPAVAVQEVKPAAAGDRTKRLVIEPAAEAIVRDAVRPDDAVAEAPAAAEDGDNPRVEPGKVKWHKDVAAAMAAAKSSGKPVLVFHLLGNLDQRFT